jgi:hypothetical protein
LDGFVEALKGFLGKLKIKKFGEGLKKRAFSKINNFEGSPALNLNKTSPKSIDQTILETN